MNVGLMVARVSSAAAEQVEKKEFPPSQPIQPEKKASIALHWQGGIWKVLACSCFALANGIVRYMTGGASVGTANPLPTYELVFLQNVFGAMLMLPWALKNRRFILSTKHFSVHFFRVLCAVIGLFFWYGSLAYLPLAQAAALAYTGPALTVLGGYLFLGEKLGAARLLSLLTCFVGAFIIVRPDIAFSGANTEYLSIAAFLPLVAAALFAGAKLTGRFMAADGESVRVMTSYLLLMMAPISFIPALIVWVTPTWTQLGYMLLVSIFTTGAHLATARALQLAEVSLLTPFGFCRIMISVIVGFVLFSEFPTSWGMWGGMAVIIAGVFLLSYDIKRDKHTERIERATVTT
jgi:drug/metabolite transporter (DMT)-like permease